MIKLISFIYQGGDCSTQTHISWLLCICDFERSFQDLILACSTVSDWCFFASWWFSPQCVIWDRHRTTSIPQHESVLFCCCCYLRSDSAIFWRDEVLLYKTPFEFKLWFTCKTSMNVFLVNHVIKWSSMLLCFKKILWIHN